MNRRQRVLLLAVLVSLIFVAAPQTTVNAPAEDSSRLTPELQAKAHSPSSDVNKGGWPFDRGLFEERRDFLALPIAPLMEARWWPAQSYSTLSFETGLRSFSGKLYIWAWIQRDLDTTSRWFTFWFDNNLIQMAYISTEFKNCVEIPADKINWGLTGHRLEVSVDGCTTTNGWKLVYLWLGIGASPTAQHTPPLDINGNPYLLLEYSPKYTSTTVTMECLVYSGEDTELQIQVQNVADTTRDRVDVKIQKDDGTWPTKGYYYTGDAKTTIDLGDYTDGSLRRVRLVFSDLTANQLYNKKIVFLGVTHIEWKMEIDYMDKDGQGGTWWTTSMISQKIDGMNAYYRKYAYHRVSYEFSDILPFDAETTTWDHWWYHNPWWLGGGGYCDYYLLKWVQTIWVYHLSGGSAGWKGAPGIAIGIRYYDYVIWHEYGHLIGIQSDEFIDGYCQNPRCVMNGTVWQPSGAYCFEHWLERVRV